MDAVRSLAADLRDLVVDLSVDGYTRTTLAMIEHDLRRSVASVLGASITLCTPAAPGTPVVVHLVSRTVGPDEIGAAVVLPLPGLSAPRRGSLTLYAAQAGAFDALVPQLAEVLHLELGQFDQHPPLPAAAIAPTVEGLHDFSVVNRALGVLLNRGHTLASARAELVRRAEQSAADVTAAAHWILGSAIR